MANKRPAPPFNWKRTLLILVPMDVVFLAAYVAGKLTRSGDLAAAGAGGLAVGLIGTVSLCIFGPLFTRPNSPQS
jgi:lipopolysaccharide export LptBFGC system permease protein LptF